MASNPGASDLQPLWDPTDARRQDTFMLAFLKKAQIKAPWVNDYESLWRWSVVDLQGFWTLVWDFVGAIGNTGPVVLVGESDMIKAKFFPEGSFNFAENLLRRRDNAEAIVFQVEAETTLQQRMSYKELHERVSQLQQALGREGMTAGERVGAISVNGPDVVVAMLASTSLGLVWSAVGADFGSSGIVDRFGQTQPSMTFCSDSFMQKGTTISIIPTLRDVRRALPTVRKVILMPLAPAKPQEGWADGAADILMSDFMGPFQPEIKLPFARLSFSHPLFVMFSSGTTGVPKCIVHQHGIGLQFLKEHKLHMDIHPGDRVFYYTSCTWMMWNWLVATLACESSLLLYDGNPFHPHPKVLFDYAEKEQATLFGVGAKFVDSLKKICEVGRATVPVASHSLPALRTFAVTGSVLVPEAFDWIYKSVKRDICLSSHSGGTDLMASFCAASPESPVYRGECAKRVLGMAMETFDEDGCAILDLKGELVCTKPFPSQPLGFLGDVDDQKYRSAYWERFPGVWCHGDYALVNSRTGGVQILGRSDTTLNPGGVRIGTAEVYRAVEAVPEIEEALCCGVRKANGDDEVALFVKLQEGRPPLDDVLRQKIREAIAAQFTRHHVPKILEQVSDIPRTRSNKIVELAVREILHGRPVKNMSALANPQALEEFKKFAVGQQEPPSRL